MIVVCCIRVGTKYGLEYVTKLNSGLKKHTTRDYIFCLDQQERFPGWWNKVLLFPPAYRTIFLDLDIVITGSVDFLFDYEGPFCAWKDPWNHAFNTSVMSIAPGFGKEIREYFLANPERAMKRYHGDQEFLADLVKPDLWPDGLIKSYKADNLSKDPKDARIVVFHGKPKPAEVDGWVQDAWV
jgi:hypothetical protein